MKINFRLFVLFGLMTLILAACSSSKPTVYKSPTKPQKPAKTTTYHSNTLVNFKETTLSYALAKAEKEGKGVFIDFYTNYCPPCKIMDKEVFSHKPLAEFLNTNFINLKVDAATQDGANIASLFGVGAYPTFVFTNSSGRELTRKEGGTNIGTIQSLAEYALNTTASNEN